MFFQLKDEKTQQAYPTGLSFFHYEKRVMPEVCFPMLLPVNSVNFSETKNFTTPQANLYRHDFME